MSFTPIRIVTESIPKTLSDFAKANKLAPRLVDFELISFDTLLQSTKSGATKVVDKVTLSQLQNSNLNIIQKYTINIIPLKELNNNKPANKEDEGEVAEEIEEKKSKLLLSLSSNSLKTKVVINIKKDTIFVNTPNVMKALKKEIWKKKLSAGFLIGILEDNLATQLLKLLKIIHYDAPLGKELKFTVATGFLPLEPIDAKLEKIYEEKIKDSNNLISGVDKDELIARYILPKHATGGRSCDGKAIPAVKPKLLDKKPSIDETITEKVLDDYIEFYANTNGYPAFHKQVFTVSNTVALKEANFRSSGLIDSGDEDIDIAVSIQHNKSESEDAIGSGVKIDVKELSVDGSIASNVKITTQTLNVDAQTHSKSSLDVKGTATIKLHRGDLVAKDAIIDVLESGKVTASSSITIRQMLGGVVIAPIVKIDEVLSNTTIIASELIEIKSILGEHNKLIIDPDSIEQYHNEIEELKQKIKHQELLYKEEKEKLEKNTVEHNSKLERIITFQQRVQKAIQTGKTPMKQDVIRVKQFKKDADKLLLEKEDLEKYITTITSLEAGLDKLANKDLYAKIRSNTLYDGHTKVVFVNVKTREELFFIPEGKIEEIYLCLNEENERVISTN